VLARVAVVVPAGGPGPLLDGVLAALRAAERPVDDLVVVDDSPGGSLTVPEGVRVVRSGGVGPYAARNVGWRSTDADVVLFADTRSRPEPSWSRRLVELFDDERVALAGTETVVVAGTSSASRAAAAQQMFAVVNYVDRPWFRPYLPTCNLAVRRSDLERVGGFDEQRSGGDADLCWRITDEPGRELRVLREPLMRWVPRERLREHLEQTYRYGRSNYRLRRAWADRGAPQAVPPPVPVLARSAGLLPLRLGWALLRRRPERVAGLTVEMGHLAHSLGTRRAAAEERRTAPALRRG
jgi:cellulose synthase/poly-beta-1,6-N-acetylglucosamine synthase-like glycosyltransferase